MTMFPCPTCGRERAALEARCECGWIPTSSEHESPPLPIETVRKGAVHLVLRFLFAGFVGLVLTAIFLPPSAWVIGYVLHGSAVSGPTGSAYYFLSKIFLWYVTPISFFVAGISAVVGHRGFGVLLGASGTMLFAMFTPGFAMTAFGLLAYVAVAVALISCGVVASRASVGWPFRASGAGSV